MADIIAADLVKETSTTQSTGPFTLSDSAPGDYQTFTEGLGLTNGGPAVECYVCIRDGTQFETVRTSVARSAGGVVTLTVLGVLDSTTGSAISWGAGTRDVYITNPGPKVCQKDANDAIGTTTTAMRFKSSAGNFTVDEAGLPANSEIQHLELLAATFSGNAAKGSFRIGPFLFNWINVTVNAGQGSDQTWETAFATFLGCVANYRNDAADDVAITDACHTRNPSTTGVRLVNGDGSNHAITVFAVGLAA